MATDVDTLLMGLTAYRETLERQNQHLSDEFRHVQSSWIALREQYEGRAAEEFAHAFGQTADWFERYFVEIKLMSKFLEERSENLKAL